MATNFDFKILQDTVHGTHFLKLMYEYKMDPTKTAGATEQTLDAGWTEGWTD